VAGRILIQTRPGTRYGQFTGYRKFVKELGLAVLISLALRILKLTSNSYIYFFRKNVPWTMSFVLTFSPGDIVKTLVLLKKKKCYQNIKCQNEKLGTLNKKHQQNKRVPSNNLNSAQTKQKGKQSECSCKHLLNPQPASKNGRKSFWAYFCSCQ
jgi:hypothetical protein